MKLKRLIAVLSAAVMLAGCASEENFSEDMSENSSQAVTTAGTTAAVTSSAETVTSAADDTSSEDDTSSQAAVSQADSSSQPEQKKPSDITPAMWEVTSENGGRLVLMGTMHSLKTQDYPLPERITGALDSSDALAVECDVIASAADPALMLKEVNDMYYKNGETISDHISAEVLDSVNKYAKSIGMDLTFYKTCKPWVYLSLFEMEILKQLDLRSDLGIDTKLIESVKESGKELIEIESAEFQLDMIAGFSDEVMEMQLASYTPENTEIILQSYKDLYQAWRTGDFDYIESQFSKDSQLANIEAEGYGPGTEEYKLLSDYIDQMQTDRNRGMAEKAAALLAEGRSVFFVVGSAHFCGKEGILSLLEEKGYEVRKI